MAFGFLMVKGLWIVLWWKCLQRHFFPTGPRCSGLFVGWFIYLVIIVFYTHTYTPWKIFSLHFSRYQCYLSCRRLQHFNPANLLYSHVWDILHSLFFEIFVSKFSPCTRRGCVCVGIHTYTLRALFLTLPTYNRNKTNESFCVYVNMFGKCCES